MFKPFVSIVSAILITSAASPGGAAQTDPITQLPLYPRITFVSKAAQNVCGTTVTIDTFSAEDDAIATVDAWYAGHLSGFKKIKGNSRNCAYDIFVNADSTSSVTVIGSGPKNAVEAVVYHHNPKPASPINLTNWLDGGDPLCE
jgi:hypothetical protein